MIRRKSYSFLILLGCIGVYLYAARLLSPFVPDDSYISFRYAENLARGFGLTFNPGEQPVEGYSNFLWILVCAFFSRFDFFLPSWIPRIGMLFGILSIGSFWILLERYRLSPVVLAAALLLFSVSAPVVLYSISGMEAPLYVFLLTTALVFLDYFLTSPRKMLWASLLSIDCVLLSLCRPEGILTLPILFACVLLLMKSGRLPELSWESLKKPVFAAATIFLVSMAGYHFWRFWYFHELVPTSFMVKGGNGVSLWNALKFNARFYFFRQNRYFAPFGYYYGTLLLCGLAMLWIWSRQKRIQPLALIAIVLSLVYSAVYVYFVDWMPGMRYHTAIVSLLLLPAICLSDIHLRKLSLPMISSFAVFLIAATVTYVSFGKLKLDGQRNEQSTLRCLVPLGEWLKQSFAPSSLLAIHDVGVVPYYSQLHTMDSNPQSLTDLHIAKNGFSAEYFFRRNPHVAIFSSEGSMKRRNFFPHYKPLFKDQRFRNKYRLVGISQYDHVFRSFWVYVRRDVPLQKKSLEKFPLGLRTSKSERIVRMKP